MMIPKTIPLIASIVQGDFSEVKIGTGIDDGVANVVADLTIFVETIIIDRTTSSLGGG